MRKIIRIILYWSYIKIVLYILLNLCVMILGYSISDYLPELVLRGRIAFFKYRNYPVIENHRLEHYCLRKYIVAFTMKSYLINKLYPK